MARRMATQLRACDFGRQLPKRSDESLSIRQQVLLDTLQALEDASSTQEFHKLASENLQRWNTEAKERNNNNNTCQIFVRPGDWGVVTADLTRQYGVMFAVLNMANAYSPGGGYTVGSRAQEENMFRRTDCHFSLDRSMIQSDGFLEEYVPEMTRLLNAKKDGRVYLDTDSPRVCIRGPEDTTSSHPSSSLGYTFLAPDEIFSFYELRAAAVNMHERRYGMEFDAEEMRRRIIAQLETLIEAKVRHVVLSAFGCGAFGNPAKHVAAIYREELETRVSDFDVVAFAIHNAGYGPDNFTPFREAFEDFGTCSSNTSTMIGDNSRSVYDSPPPKKVKADE